MAAAESMRLRLLLMVVEEGMAGERKGMCRRSGLRNSVVGGRKRYSKSVLRTMIGAVVVTGRKTFMRNVRRRGMRMTIK